MKKFSTDKYIEEEMKKLQQSIDEYSLEGLDEEEDNSNGISLGELIGDFKDVDEFSVKLSRILEHPEIGVIVKTQMPQELSYVLMTVSMLDSISDQFKEIKQTFDKTKEFEEMTTKKQRQTLNELVSIGEKGKLVEIVKELKRRILNKKILPRTKEVLEILEKPYNG